MNAFDAARPTRSEGLRVATPEDAHAILNGIARNGRSPSRDLGSLIGDSERFAGLVLHTSRGIVAHLGFERLTVKLQRDLKVASLRAAFIDPEYRVSGPDSVLHLMMNRLWHDAAARAGVDILIACFDPRDLAYLQRASKFIPLGSRLTFHPRASAPQKPAQLRLREGLPESAALSPELALAAAPDFDRAQRHARNGGQILSALDADGRTQGWILHDPGPAASEVLDLVAASPCDLREMLLAARASGNPFRIAVWNPRATTAHALQDAGFHVGPFPEPIIMAKWRGSCIKRRQLASELQLLPVHTGLSALPMLSGGDQVVYPPFFSGSEDD